MIKAILRWFGYYKMDYGFATGRHWIEIDGKMIYQGNRADIWIPDETVRQLGEGIFKDCEWKVTPWVR